MKTSEKNGIRPGLWIVGWFLVLGLVLAGVGYWGMDLLNESLNAYQQQVDNPRLASDLAPVLRSAFEKVALCAAGGLAVVGVLLWLTLRSAMRRKIAEQGPVKSVTAPSAELPQKTRPEVSSEDKEKQAQMDQRRSLQLLSLLQREGRLVDFLQEDLRAYDDAQIGAAVRSIHESCRESLSKYVSLQPVIDRNEGEPITVDPGFDAQGIRLTGKTAGKPPFKGILQHRGWRCTELKLPTLAGSQDPTVIVPAEVEIE